MLVAAAVCPHPPILVPQVASGAAAELDELRGACDEAVRRLLEAEPGRLVVVGGAPHTRGYDATAQGDLRPYGVDMRFGGRPGGPRLPLSLTIGAWLLQRASCDLGGVRYQAVGFAEPASACLRLGEQMAAAHPRLGLLVMGDGSACRTEQAPGYLDERAAPYDAAAARALANADTAALAALDPALSQELRAAGRAAWQVLAGAAGNAAFTAELLADQAPYGVGYLVASWMLAQVPHGT